MSTINLHSGEPSSSRVKRCTKCGNPEGRESTKNLVVCIDGTSNEFGHTNTNVVEMFTQIDQDTSEKTRVKQYAYYSGGIGTDPRSSNILSRMGRGISNSLDMAFALNVNKNVLEAYAWLAGAYNEGDQIYLFGFSRGAYQVRVLASMIHEIGLLKVPTEKQITKAYDYYKAIHSGHWAAKDMAKKFKNAFSWRGTRAHFVGVWDTVCSVGLVKEENFLSASSSAEQACHLRHALALDECRVKFMPEYFYKVNSRTGDTMSDKVDPSGSPDIKEVWFAGYHSDVGGRGRSESHRAGNVSLLWMRREATAKGLVLRPTDVVWTPSDIDFGIKDSMSRIWRFLEYVPFVHFSGTGGNSQFWHGMQPRRIIPGQKVHASILYANTYEPRASHGEGFYVPMDRLVPLPELPKNLWETEFFYGAAAKELVDRLHGPQGVATTYLDRLLFMLRFEEGKQSFRNTEDWERKFTDLIHSKCGPLVKIGVIIAYYEVSGYSPGTDLEAPHVEGLEKILDSAESVFRRNLSGRQGSAMTVLAFMRYLAKYENLRGRILTPDVLTCIMHLFDAELRRLRQTGFILSIMDALTCLLQCNDNEIQKFIINALRSPGDPRHSMPFQTLRIPVQIPGAKLIADSRSRLSKILRFLDSQFLVGALYMLKILAQILDEKARSLCSTVKPTLRRLAQKDKQRIGLLSFEILLILYVPGSTEKGQLNMKNANVRAHMAGALARLSADGRDSTDGQSRDTDPVRLALCKLYGVDTPVLAEKHMEPIRELKEAVQNGNARERTAATSALLKLCETDHIRTFLCKIGLVEVFIHQLKAKDSALLAASALVTCLKYKNMKERIENNERFLKNTVEMLRHDYSDDVVGRADGFRTIKVLIQQGTRHQKKTEDHSIVEALKKKLLKGKPREIHTSLMCLNILRSFDENDTDKLFEKSLECLRKPGWKDQKTGLRILSALAQTERGVAVIGPNICKIIQMLLPSPLSAQSTASTSAANPTESPIQLEAMPRIPADSNPTEVPIQLEATPDVPADSTSLGSLDAPPKPAFRLMGPACALWILVLNKNLRDRTRGTSDYTDLKHLCLTRTLFDPHHTSRWYVYTPDQADVMKVLHKVFEVVDEKLPDDSLISIGDVILPRVQHWGKLGGLLLDAVEVSILATGGIIAYTVVVAGAWAVFGVAVGGMVVVAPIWLLRKLLTCFRSSRPPGVEAVHESGNDPDAHEVASGDNEHTRILQLIVGQIQFLNDELVGLIKKVLRSMPRITRRRLE